MRSIASWTESGLVNCCNGRDLPRSIVDTLILAILIDNNSKYLAILNKDEVEYHKLDDY